MEVWNRITDVLVFTVSCIVIFRVLTRLKNSLLKKTEPFYNSLKLHIEQKFLVQEQGFGFGLWLIAFFLSFRQINDDTKSYTEDKIRSLTILGLYGGWISRFSSFCQSMCLKKMCSRISDRLFPSLLWGSFVMSCTQKLFNSTVWKSCCVTRIDAVE